MAGEFKRAGDRIVADTAKALEDGAIEIMGQADVLVPKDTETLRESARIFPPFAEGDRIVVEFGYGFGGAVNPKTGHQVGEYAVPVHEILEAFHEPPTQAKFLEQPLFVYAGRMEGEISADLRVEWGRPGPGATA